MRGWLLGFHLIGVILWMGGLMTFSRILGYHTKEAPSARPRLSFIEGRLNALVTIPGMVLTIAFGLWLISFYGAHWFSVARWMHYKLVLVSAVLFIHIFLTIKQRQIQRQSPSDKLNRALYAALHGTIGLLMIGIVLLATLQPMK